MLLIFVLFISLLSVDNVLLLPLETTEIAGEQHFYYFGYGSNLLGARIHIQNPSAVRVAAGKLEDYRLDFHTYTKRWLGAAATIVPTPNCTVYGALWLIAMRNLADIDNQEGVHEGIYAPVSVPIKLLTNGTVITARSYVLVSQPTTPFHDYLYDDVPVERQPSKTYLQCLVKGAIESELPLDYVEWMRSVHHNQQVETTLEAELDLQNTQLLH